MTAGRGVIEGEDRPRSLITAIVQWWNWRLAVKLVAVLLLPVLAVVALGTWLVVSEVRRADSYARADSLVSVKAAAQELLNGLQDERTMSAQFLGGTGVNDPAVLLRQSQKVDAAKADTERGVVLSHNSDVSARYAEVAQELGSLPLLRQTVRAHTTDAATAQGQYTAVVNSLLRFDQALVSQIGDPGLSSTATALYNLSLADEQITVQHAVIAAGIGRGRLQPDEVLALQSSAARWDDRMADFRAVASQQQIGAYVSTVTGPDVLERQRLLHSALDQAAKSPPRQGPELSLNPAEWNRVSANVTGMNRAMLGSGINQLRASSAALQDSSSNLAGTEAVILVSILAVAVTVLTAVGRNLVTSLGTLRRTALDVAGNRLPAEVASIRDGHKADTAVEPVPVSTTEEVGQLARAVDTLHGEAVRLAVEQSELRDNLNTAFVNVSRRSQSMVEHLLRELEQLERNEEDPDQLSSLFTLDHLATRMRRNNENLVLLSGSDLSRRFTQPLPLADILRAGVSEIEQYERVAVRPSPEVHVAGYAAGDVVRLLAELLDNATKYSSPDTEVAVGGHQKPDGRVVVEVRDQGIGMGEADLANANARLAEGAVMDAEVSRQMGLFVVGRLARKHGVQVRLCWESEGLRAIVTLPGELLTVVEPVESTITMDTSSLSVPGQRTRDSEAFPGESDTGRHQLRHSGEILPEPQDVVDGWPPEQPATSGGPTRAVPGLPPASSPAADLFTPVTPATEPNFDDWTDFPAAPEENHHSEHSGQNNSGVGWFDDAPPFGEDAGDGAKSRPQEPGKSHPSSWWTSPSPEGWQAAKHVAESQPAAHTAAGLPRRKPREHLLPGSATPSEPRSPRPGRDPDKLRRRITSLQAGSTDGQAESPRRSQHRFESEGDDW